ncbi:MAG: lipase maturation factor family protein [Actinobacteria bacterium]|nr:lipase maturation factor family protein [Actinomycetota bacterium]
MEWLVAPQYWLARLVFQRLLGVVYLVAFISAFNQFAALAGERGLLPCRPYLRRLGFRRAPSLFHLHYSDRFARATAALGIALSVGVVAGVVERLPLAAAMGVWLALWVLYLSFVNAGQVFFGFVWETLLLEAGFLAVFLGSADVAPLLPAALALRWLLFRLEVGAGLIKLRNDPAWRDLTALYYHHETQPIPNRLSRWFHHLPKPVHRLEAIGNHVAQIVAPFALFMPQPLASVAGTVIVVTQLWLMASGNFAWLNVLTIALAAMAFDDRFLSNVLPVSPPAVAAPPGWFAAAAVLMAVAMLALSWRPVRNMASRHQVMNASYNPWHIGNTYGLFGHITRERLEVVIQGTDDPVPTSETEWKTYEFKAKPGDVRRPPRQVAPYHLRLDWLLWFAALSPVYAQAWFLNLVSRLLEGDDETLRLMGGNPFPERPPTFVRALLYRYRFTTPSEQAQTGAWWQREPVGLYLPPVTLRLPADHRPAPAALSGGEPGTRHGPRRKHEPSDDAPKGR